MCLGVPPCRIQASTSSPMAASAGDVADNLDKAGADGLGVDRAGSAVVVSADTSCLHGVGARLARKTLVRSGVLGNEIQSALTEARANLFGLGAATLSGDFANDSGFGVVHAAALVAVISSSTVNFA